MKNESGQGLVEYLVLVCLVAVSAIGVVSLVGTNIKELYAKVSGSLQGESQSITFSRAKKNDYQRRGMNDFEESARAQK